MLDGNILVPHRLGFVLRVHQHLVGIDGEIHLTAGYLHKLLNKLRRLYLKSFMINIHLRQKSVNQTLLLGQQAQKQMLLPNLLVTILLSEFLTILHCLQGLLCKFI